VKRLHLYAPSSNKLASSSRPGWVSGSVNSCHCSCNQIQGLQIITPNRPSAESATEFRKPNQAEGRFRGGTSLESRGIPRGRCRPERLISLVLRQLSPRIQYNTAIHAHQNHWRASWKIKSVRICWGPYQDWSSVSRVLRLHVAS
jgi:hypothetical protein